LNIIGFFSLFILQREACHLDLDLDLDFSFDIDLDADLDLVFDLLVRGIDFLFSLLDAVFFFLLGFVGSNKKGFFFFFVDSCGVGSSSAVVKSIRKAHRLL
jgi:hypothetical protein